MSAPDTAAEATARPIRGVDNQVLLAAAQLPPLALTNPEWIWTDMVRMTFGRWADRGSEAPYIRADLILADRADLLARSAQADTLRAEVEALRAALEPFAKAAVTIEEDNFPDSYAIHGARNGVGEYLYQLTGGDFRRARALLSGDRHD